MNETPRASASGFGGCQSSTELLPEVYHQLRHLAAARLSHEKPGQTLQATALVHEAWLRIAGLKHHTWHSRAEFFNAAAQAMRRILIENARRKQRRRALEGGDRVPLEYAPLISPLPDEELLALDEGLRELARNHPRGAQLVELRFFAGLTQAEAAEQMGISRSTADRLWLLARSWLYARIRLPEEIHTDHRRGREPVRGALRYAPPGPAKAEARRPSSGGSGAQPSAPPT
jgi:RNA polymerase sigma factor (TIGR02999 family)